MADVALPPLEALEYPYVFFPVGLNLRGRPCIVIGDDREASEKDEALREVGADVTWLRDPGGVRDEDVAGAFFVISTPQDPAFAARMRALADEYKFLLCAIDQPAHGFVAMQAVVKAGPVRIAVSTGGVAPRAGGTIRAALQGVLDAKFERFIACLNAQRERNKRRLSQSGERRAAMIRAAEGFEMDVSVRYPAWFEQEVAGLGPSVEASPERGTAGERAVSRTASPPAAIEPPLTFVLASAILAVLVNELRRP